MRRTLTACGAELLGLFVDDLPFALMIVAWLGIVAWFAPLRHLPPDWRGAVLCVGLVLCLFASCLRAARHPTSGRS